MSKDIFNMNMFTFKLNEVGRVQTRATANGSGAHAGNVDLAQCKEWKSQQSVPAASCHPRGACQREDGARLFSGVHSKKAIIPSQHWHYVKRQFSLMGPSRAGEQAGERICVFSTLGDLEIFTTRLDKAWTTLSNFSAGSKFEIGRVLWRRIDKVTPSGHLQTQLCNDSVEAV